jgi:hypothetical protein
VQSLSAQALAVSTIHWNCRSILPSGARCTPRVHSACHGCSCWRHLISPTGLWTFSTPPVSSTDL